MTVLAMDIPWAGEDRYEDQVSRLVEAERAKRDARRRVDAEERGTLDAAGASVDLRDVTPRDRLTEAEYDVLGITLPRHHPSIIFGDGGTLKSYIALKVASDLAHAGVKVGYFDWELDADTHAWRLHQINGPERPSIRYERCDSPLVEEVARIRRAIDRHQLDYLVLDSAGYGTRGAAETSESSMEYFRGLRQCERGALILAHVTKAETGDQRPFGSTFWHNSARSTWNIKRAQTSPDGDLVQLAAFHRKCNLGPLRSAQGISVAFDADCVRFSRCDPAGIDEIASTLPLWQRIQSVLKAGPQTVAVIAAELNHENVDSLSRTIRRYDMFVKTVGADGITRIALAERARR